jgi:PucR family transcriptional regulator, purine catabolism regulatory protein
MSNPSVSHEAEWSQALDNGARRMVSGLSRQNSVYRYMIDIWDQVADATLTGAGVRQLAQTFARLIRRTVVLLDPSFGVHAVAGADDEPRAQPPWRLDDPGVVRVLRALAADRRPLRVPAVPDSVLSHGCLAVPIGVGATELGYLLILDGADDSARPPDDVDLLIASYVATWFALTLVNERASVDLGLRYQIAVVDALAAGHFTDADDARRKMEALGFSAGTTYQVGIIRPTADGGQPQLPAEQADELREAVVRALPEAVVAVRPAELVIIVAAQPSVADLLRQAVERRAVALPPRAPVVCGISDPGDRPDAVPQLYCDAGHAIEVANRMARFGRVVSYGDLGIYRLLLQIGDESRLTSFAESVLGPVIRYDAAHKLALVQTLAVFLNQRESLKQAARRLHVHANTVTYRLQRIEQLVPLRLSDPEDRLLAHVAVKILELQQERSPEPPGQPANSRSSSTGSAR